MAVAGKPDDDALIAGFFDRSLTALQAAAKNAALLRLVAEIAQAIEASMRGGGKLLIADGKAPLNVADHPWRKPNPGMIVAAAEQMKLDLAHSWIAGDRASDLAAGKAAGLAGGILISPRADGAERAAAMRLRGEDFAVDVASSLADAIAALLAPGRLILPSSAP